MFIFQAVQDIPSRRRNQAQDPASTNQPTVHPSPSNQPVPAPANVPRPVTTPAPQTLQPGPTIGGQPAPRNRPDPTELMLRVARESPEAEAAMESLLSPRDPSRRGFDRDGFNRIITPLQALDPNLYRHVTEYLRSVPRERDADARYLALAAYAVIDTTPMSAGSSTDSTATAERTRALDHIKTQLLQFAQGVELRDLSSMIPVRRTSPNNRA